MNQLLKHRGPDDEGYVFIDPAKDNVWIYGGKDTPEEVYSANLIHTPQRPYRGQEHPDATIAFGHRRLSIIDLSPAGHQPFCTPDQRYWIVYNGEIYNYLELRENLKRKGYIFKTKTDTEVLLYAYIHWGPSALERLVGMFAFAIYDRIENSLFLARDLASSLYISRLGIMASHLHLKSRRYFVFPKLVGKPMHKRFTNIFALVLLITAKTP